MPKPPREVLTPASAFSWLEDLPPMEIKNRLLDYLRWQAEHGKRLLHSAHYFRIVKFGAAPRASTMARRELQTKQMLGTLTESIGRPVPTSKRAP